jgi:hypothetical protein
MTRYRQIWAWTRFTLSEYLRSGRILFELGALIVFAYIFLRKPNTAAILYAPQFFSMTAVFVLAQSIYTSSVLMNMGSRAQGYVVLARPLGRKGYLMGLFLVAVIIGVMNFVLCSLIVTLINRPFYWNLIIWGAGALPLILDVALVAALVMLLSGLVLTSGWRLLVLGVVALASLGSADIFSKVIALDSTFGKLLSAVRTLVGIPLTPLLAGFELTTQSAQRNYGAQSLAIVLGQIMLLVAVLAFSMTAFDRRDIILN